MTTNKLEKMIDRYVRKGGNRATGVALLNEIITAHDGDNLTFALSYYNFIA